MSLSLKGLKEFAERSVFQNPRDVTIVLSHPVGKDYGLLDLAGSKIRRFNMSISVSLEGEALRRDSHC